MLDAGRIFDSLYIIYFRMYFGFHTVRPCWIHAIRLVWMVSVLSTIYLWFLTVFTVHVPHDFVFLCPIVTFNFGRRPLPLSRPKRYEGIKLYYISVAIVSLKRSSPGEAPIILLAWSQRDCNCDLDFPCSPLLYVQTFDFGRNVAQLFSGWALVSEVYYV